MNPSKLSKLFKQYNIFIHASHHKSLVNIIKSGKQVSELLDRTNVVYKIECKQFMYAYISETKHASKKRVDEDKKNTNSQAVINCHKKNYNRDFAWDDVKILDYESNWYKRRTSEMLDIVANVNDVYSQVIDLFLAIRTNIVFLLVFLLTNCTFSNLLQYWYPIKL